MLKMKTREVLRLTKQSKLSKMLQRILRNKKRRWTPTLPEEALLASKKKKSKRLKGQRKRKKRVTKFISERIIRAAQA